jgi:SepF-like predicted cell division protein (DUF552 family)
VEELARKLDALRKDAARVSGVRAASLHELAQVENRLTALEAEDVVLARVADVFRALIDREVVDNATLAQELLTEGLRAVFDDLHLSVRSQVDIQRGKVSVDLITTQVDAGTLTEGSSVDAYGGSVATVQSVLLRIVVTHRRGLRPLILLDESLAAVAEHYVPRVGRFLRMLAERLGVDILAVSHSQTLVEEADLAYRIHKKDGEAQFRPIRS